MKREKWRPSPGTLFGLIAIVIALAGTAVARQTASTSAVGAKGVKKIAAKQVRLLAPGLSVASAKTATSATTAANAVQLGGVDASGYQRTVRWAEIEADASTATVANGNATGASKAGGTPGLYQVNFDPDISNCAIVATNKAAAGGGEVLAKHLLSTTSLDVLHLDSTGAGENYSGAPDGFFVAVFC